MVAWIKSPEGQSPNALDLTGRVVRRINADTRIDYLFKQHLAEPQIKIALGVEYDRRIASQQQARAVAQDLSSDEASSSRYEPIPSTYVRHEALRNLVLLLNGRSPPEQIAEAARKVRNDRDSAEEVYQHGIGLAVAYTQALQDRPVTHISQDRYRGREF